MTIMAGAPPAGQAFSIGPGDRAEPQHFPKQAEAVSYETYTPARVNLTTHCLTDRLHMQAMAKTDGAEKGRLRVQWNELFKVMPRPKMLSSSESIAPKGCAAVGGSAVGPATVPARESAIGLITFLLPSCFLTLSGFRFNPLGDRVLKSEWGVASSQSAKKKRIAKNKWQIVFSTI